MAPDPEKVTYSQFACIGTGFSGIGLGATLRRWYGITDIRFFERHSDLGGTWFINQYPGCACDIPSILYSFSFAPNPNWTTPLPSSAELWAYLKDVAEKYGLVSKMTFGANVENCTWIEETHRWRVKVRDVESGTYFTHECQILFSGCGSLVEPRKPDMPGIDSFKGPVFPAARWRHDVELRGKNVAVFGNGCTGTQIVPAIVDKTNHLTHFFRSKHWIVPAVKVPNTAVMQWLFKNVPGVMAAIRLRAYFGAETAWEGVPLTEKGERWRRRREAAVKKFVRETAPEKYYDMLIPDFEIGCKRRIFDSGYLECLHKDNVTLTDARVEEVLPDGLRTTDGTFIPTDVIVLANGYSTNNYLPGITVRGRQGLDIHTHWDEDHLGGPSAYNCTAVSGFPNFFILLGPNAATGHTSTILAAENGVNFALRVARPVIEGEALDAELTPEAEEEYVRDVQESLRETVFATGCASWYVRKADGNGERAWNAMTYPWSQAHLWYRCLFPNYGHWKYTPAPHALRKKFQRYLFQLFRLTVYLSLLTGTIGLLQRNAWSVSASLSSIASALDTCRRMLLP